jgi:hypothetical protein
MSVPDELARASLADRVRAAFVTPASTDVAAPLAGRDARLDMFRGLALVMIFINHVPGNFYEAYTSRNFGFSDAAEAFVFMSGMAAGLAYSNSFRSGPLWPAIARVWSRARQLYFVHLSITFVALGLFAAAALWLGATELLGMNNLGPIFAHPLEAMIGIPLLTHQLGYLNILPLYAVMLLATPLLIPIGLRWPLGTLVGSVLLWMIAGQFRLNFPNYPTSGGWFFNPFSWELLFVIGLLCGMAMKVGQHFVPRNSLVFSFLAAFVVFILFWVKVPALGDAGREALGALSKFGLPFYVTWFDKTFLALPRLAHALALFYVLAYLTPIRWFAGTNLAAPLRLLGRHGLAIFASGTVLSLALQAVRVDMKADPLADGIMLGGGLLLLWGLAWSLSATGKSRAAPSGVTP